ncbi:hypothetical protein GXW78_09785 [Roseomonas terrae]|uniref:Uncharacterized protein n=1 Tax=Neoroseomonas terrae TaxID=424799 RepID=A0ABS5EG06_9PROT|nr:hypothetical protein [Neoroseomonas terrae]MBR0649953.1 hypothetical protein [Neoroseomonas terrae]
MTYLIAQAATYDCGPFCPGSVVGSSASAGTGSFGRIFLLGSVSEGGSLAGKESSSWSSSGVMIFRVSDFG